MLSEQILTVSGPHIIDSASNALGRSDCSVLRLPFFYLPPSLLLQNPSSNSAYLLQTSAHQDINIKQDICWETLEEDSNPAWEQADEAEVYPAGSRYTAELLALHFQPLGKKDKLAPLKHEHWY
jgi:hypothetical protein